METKLEDEARPPALEASRRLEGPKQLLPCSASICSSALTLGITSSSTSSPLPALLSLKRLLSSRHWIEDSGHLFSNLCGIEVHLSVCGLHTTLHTEHVTEGVLIAMLHLKQPPRLPKVVDLLGIAVLRRMVVNAASSVHFAKHSLHLRKPHTGILDLVLWEALDGLLINFTSPCLTKELGGLPEQDDVHIIHLLFLNCLGCSGVDGQCMASQAMVLF
mmetsp:Transcript_37540/g.86681  ORF Transcript_37540/g.86681 Transcript_37540/m.86681 type:complete len:218 (-) Transcript_37540:1832-2485(-)